jgi:thiosulfate reductase cytochrome b subunit
MDDKDRGIPEVISHVLSGVYSYCRRGLSASYRRLARGLATAVLGLVRLGEVSYRGFRKALARFRRTRPVVYPYYRHSRPVRIMHWCNVLFLYILLLSGLNIFGAHQALYWGKSSYQGAPPVFEIGARENERGELLGMTRVFGHEFDSTGFLGVSKDRDGEPAARGFPSWLTIPDSRWLAMARRWHFFFAWMLVLNGLAFVLYAVFSRHLRRDLIPTRPDLRSIGSSIMDHARFRHASGEAAKEYNVLQKLAYLSVIFFLFPLMILMGLGMSPALDALYPGWVDIFFGRQSIRTIHFIVAWMLVLFVAVHVFEVIVTGFWNNIRSMITGYYRIEDREGP